MIVQLLIIFSRFCNTLENLSEKFIEIYRMYLHKTYLRNFSFQNLDNVIYSSCKKLIYNHVIFFFVTFIILITKKSALLQKYEIN